jgi:phosphocarrier protein HPr
MKGPAPVLKGPAPVPSATAEIVNKLGLHARASAKLTQVASAYGCEIWLTRNGRRVNAKSIMGVMMLAAGKGSSVTVEAEGTDADQALAAILKLIADRFGEGE